MNNNTIKSVVKDYDNKIKALRLYKYINTRKLYNSSSRKPITSLRRPSPTLKQILDDQYVFYDTCYTIKDRANVDNINNHIYPFKKRKKIYESSHQNT